VGCGRQDGAMGVRTLVMRLVDISAVEWLSGSVARELCRSFRCEATRVGDGGPLGVEGRARTLT